MWLIIAPYVLGLPAVFAMSRISPARPDTATADPIDTSSLSSDQIEGGKLKKSSSSVSFAEFKLAAGAHYPRTAHDQVPGCTAGLRKNVASVEEFLLVEPDETDGATQWDHRRWRFANLIESTPGRVLSFGMVCINAVLIGGDAAVYLERGSLTVCVCQVCRLTTQITTFGTLSKLRSSVSL